MKILCLHCNHIRYEATKKAIKEPEQIDKKSGGAKNCLVIFMAVEKRDESAPENSVKRLLKEIKDIAEKVKTKSIVLYPYVHLTNTPSSPKTALRVLDLAESGLKGFTVSRSPFGWYKRFEIDVKGHPLAELSREFGPEEEINKSHGHDQEFEFNKKKLSEEEKVNLTTAIVVGKAVKELFPDAEIGTSDFYHEQTYVDIHGVKIKADDFPKIEKKVKEIISKDLNFKLTKEVKGKFQKEIAKGLIESRPYDLNGLTIVPLHKDPFVSTKKIGAFKILNLASAYWKGNAENPQLVRIYCIGFKSEKNLKSYLDKLVEAEKRDHRKIGQHLDLFSFNEISPGSPFFHPKGTQIYLTLQNFLRELYTDWGYEEVITPLIYGSELWQQSGHWDHFRENMFELEMDNKEAALKPMNCPSHILIYKTQPKSYRDLPIRIADFAPLHRNELKGTLGGLMRVRKFSQDDCHVFCTPEQVKDEINNLIRNAKYVYEDVFGLKFHVELSTKPEKAMGDPKLWDLAEKALEKALKENKVNYKLNPGDGAFYGPKIDFHIKDALDRSWQCGTEQLDFQQPERFNVKYEGKDGKGHNVVMLHRTVLGALERFIGILIEHYAGNFPLWLNPRQVRVITITDRDKKFAEEVFKELKEKKIKVEIDDRNETMGRKVREAQLEKVNYIVTIGDKEAKSKTLAIRSRKGDLQFKVKLSNFIDSLIKEIKERK